MPRLALRKGWLVLLPLFLISVISSLSPAKAADGNKLVFSWQEAVVYQEVNVPNNWAASSSLTATVSAAEAQDWKASSDTLAIAINLYGPGGGGIYSHSTGYLTLTDGGTFNDYSLTVTAAGVGEGWSQVASVRLSLIGQDGEFWAGNYGTQIETASLELDGTELLTNTEFNTNSGWTSSLGWQTCSGGSGALPCVGLTAVQINNATTTTTSTTTTTPTTTTTTTTTVPPAGQGTETTEQFEGPGPALANLTVQVGGNNLTTSNQGGWRYQNMGNGYGTQGVAIYADYPSQPLVFNLPSTLNPRSFYFRVGAKNGDETGSVTYADGTTGSFTIGNSVLTAGCSTCQAPGYYKEIYFNGNGKIIISFSLPAGGGDIYFVDMLRISDSTSVASVVDPNPAATTTTTSTTTTTTTTTTVPLSPAEFVVTPSDISTTASQNQIELSDDFEVSGFSSSSNLLVSITVSGSTTAKINLPTTTGLTLESGYTSWTNTSQINFTGNQANINTALDAMTLNSGSTVGSASLTIEVSEKVNNTAFFNGHLYEFVPGNISYLNARTAARTRTINGVSGYLVTITSDAEHNFVLSKIQGAYNIWIALSDRATEGDWVLDPYDGSSEQGTLVWRGVSNGFAQGGNYAKWCGGEPNNSGNEDAAVTKWNGGNCWNDLPDSWSSVGGYVAEYDMPSTVVVSDSMSITVTAVPTTTTTTTIAPYFNAVQNLIGTANQNGSVSLDWNVPSSGNLSPYMYDVSWFDLNNGSESGGWGVWTYATNTSYVVGSFQFPNTTGYGPVRFKVRAGNAACVGESSGSCVYGPYASVDVTVLDPTLATTTTTVPATTTTTVYVPTVTTTTQPEPEPETQPDSGTTTTTQPAEEEVLPPDTTLPEPEDVEPEETTPETLPIDEPETPQPETEPETELTPEETSPVEEIEEKEESSSQDEIVIEQDATTEEILEALEEAAPEQIAEVLAELGAETAAEILDKLPAEQLTEVIENIDTEQLTEILNELSEEQAAELIESVETAEALENIIKAISTNEDEPIEAAVAVAIILNESFSDITAEAATEVFANVDPGTFSEEQKSELSAALTEAPAEIKEAFEEEINIYAEGFDEYVPTGSTVDVGARRTLIAAAAVLSTIAVAGATGGLSGGSGGPSGGGSGGGSSPSGSSAGSGTNDAARREEELEEEGEEAGGIEGPEDDEEDIYLTRNSIFNYYIEGGIEMKKMNWFGLGKKVWETTAGLAFTLAGSFVMFVTLSGDTRKMAIIATAVALGVHYVHEILKNDEE